MARSGFALDQGKKTLSAILTSWDSLSPSR
jgi:hypothetical protein